MLHICFSSLLPAVTVSASPAAPLSLRGELGKVSPGTGGKASARVTNLRVAINEKKEKKTTLKSFYIFLVLDQRAETLKYCTQKVRGRVKCVCEASFQSTAVNWLS